MTVRLSDLVRGKDRLSKRQVALLKRWLEEDWEAADVDREILKLIRRLVATLEDKGNTMRLLRGRMNPR